MKRIICVFIITALAAGSVVAQKARVRSIEDWLALPAAERPSLDHCRFAYDALSKKKAAQTAQLLLGVYNGHMRERYKDVWSEKSITDGDNTLRFEYRVFGEEPADGRSLYISMHGGGNAPAQVNDKQWENQVRLYTPEEGIYVAPRAPWDDWNMWFKPGLDELYELLVYTAVLEHNVNPDKIYLMGYSAGGDGVYRLAPRMADRWAAASMMAGHPGEASQVNLRNLPFMIWMGGDDKAYNRNEEAARCGRALDSLQAADPAGYIHETHILEGKGHWMNREDTVAVQWMANYTRDPYPDKIVWRQEDVVRTDFYWLSVPAYDAEHGMEVIVNREGNTINIEKNDYIRLQIWLNDEMFDLNKPIIVKRDGEEIFRGKVERTLYSLALTLERRKDPRYMFPAKLTVDNNSQVK